MDRHFAKPIARMLYLAWLNVPFARPLLDRLMQRVFSGLADGWTQRTGWEGRLAPLDAALHELDPSPVRIVDLGCGTAEATIELARRFRSAWVIGIDIAEEMLEQASSAARDAGVAVQFIRGSIDHTGLEDRSVDLAVLVNAPPAFNEVARILSPAGLAIVICTQGADTWFYSSAKRLRRGFAKAGMTEACSGTAGNGEYFAAAHAAVPARNPVADQSIEVATRGTVAGVPH